MKSDFRKPENNLEERTFKFAQNIINLCKSINQNVITRPIISQLVKSGTSVGANYRESQNASSRKDFRNKLYICKKEISETEYWLKLLKEYDFARIDLLEKESRELILIFGKSISSINKTL